MTHLELCRRALAPLAVAVGVVELDNVIDVAPFVGPAAAVLVYCYVHVLIADGRFRFRRNRRNTHAQMDKANDP